LKFLIKCLFWDHSTLLLFWEHTWLTFSFISSSHLPYYRSTSTLHLHQKPPLPRALLALIFISAAFHLLFCVFHGSPSSRTPRTSINWYQSHPSLWCIHPLGLGKVLGPYLYLVSISILSLFSTIFFNFVAVFFMFLCSLPFDIEATWISIDSSCSTPFFIGANLF